MSFLTTLSRASKGATCALALTFLGASSADAQVQSTVVIDDSFANGFSDLSGAGLEFDFYTSSSGSGLPADVLTPGPLDFASGTSGRSIHGLFAEQTLAAVGDSIDLTFDFTVPATVAASMTEAPNSFNEDFRWALFSTSRAPNGQADFAQRLSASSASPNPILEFPAGVVGEIDNINANGTDLGLRTHNVNALTGSNASTSSATSDGTPSGLLLNTTGAFDFITGGPDDEITVFPNTSYTGRMLIELNDPTMETLCVTVEVFDADGVLLSTHTDDLIVEDAILFDDMGVMLGDGETIGVNTLSFDMVSFHASSGAFGTSTLDEAGETQVIPGEPNNGIDISNITLTAVTTGDDAGLLGDVNLDGMVTFADIQPFIDILATQGFQFEADINGDGLVTFADIQPFIDILAGG